MPSNNEYLELKKSLEEKIAAIEAKVNIINECKRTHRAATAEEAEKFDAVYTSINDNEIALMLEAKATKRNRKKTKNDAYEPFLITSETSDEFSRMLASLPTDQSFHFDVILRNGVHCTPLQIHSDGNGKVRTFFIDASGDNSNSDGMKQHSSSLNAEAHKVRNTRVQKSQLGCSIFGIQDLNSMSKLTQDELINSTMLDIGGNPVSLNPRFMKNAQSMTELKKYIESNEEQKDNIVSKNRTLEEHVEDFSITVEAGKEADGTIKTKSKNISITLKTAKYLKAALATLEENHKNGTLETALNNRKGEAVFNKIYQNLGLTKEQQGRVKGLYSAEEIELVLKYNLPKENFFEAKCFAD